MSAPRTLGRALRLCRRHGYGPLVEQAIKFLGSQRAPRYRAYTAAWKAQQGVQS